MIEEHARLDDVDDVLRDHAVQLATLDKVKAVDTVVQENIKRIDDHQREKDIASEKMQTHLVALDNYLDKFQPMRTQDQI